MKTKRTLAFTLFFFAIIIALVFIMKSNDHLECGNRYDHATDLEGNRITTKQHICREAFNW